MVALDHNAEERFVDAEGQTSPDKIACYSGRDNKNVPGQQTQQTPRRSPGLGGLRRPDRMALDLRLRGLTYQQIAVVLNLSTTTAHKAVRRALARRGQRQRKVLLKIAVVHRGLLRDGQVDLRTVVREFHQARTPRQLGQLHQLTLRFAREKTGRTKEDKPRESELNPLAPNNLQLEKQVGKQAANKREGKRVARRWREMTCGQKTSAAQAENQPDTRPGNLLSKNDLGR